MSGTLVEIETTQTRKNSNMSDPKGSHNMINLLSAATSPPRHSFKTSELIAALMHKLSPELINTINSLGVDQRYSTLENYPEFLSGKRMRATSSTTQLGVEATRKCIEQWQGDQSKHGCIIDGTYIPEL